MGPSFLSRRLLSGEHENLKEQLKYMQFFCKVGGNLIKGWWATIWAEARRNDIMVGGNLLQAERTKEKRLFEQLENVCRWQTLIPMGNSNLPDNWQKGNKVGRKQSKWLLEGAKGKLLA